MFWQVSKVVCHAEEPATKDFGGDREVVVNDACGVSYSQTLQTRRGGHWMTETLLIMFREKTPHCQWSGVTELPRKRWEPGLMVFLHCSMTVSNCWDIPSWALRQNAALLLTAWRLENTLVLFVSHRHQKTCAGEQSMVMEFSLKPKYPGFFKLLLFHWYFWRVCCQFLEDNRTAPYSWQWK